MVYFEKVLHVYTFRVTYIIIISWIPCLHRRRVTSRTRQDTLWGTLSLGMTTNSNYFCFELIVLTTYISVTDFASLHLGVFASTTLAASPPSCLAVKNHH